VSGRGRIDSACRGLDGMTHPAMEVEESTVGVAVDAVLWW